MQTTRAGVAKGRWIWRETVGGSSCLAKPQRLFLDGNLLESLQVGAASCGSCPCNHPKGRRDLWRGFPTLSSYCIVNKTSCWGVGGNIRHAVFLYSMSDIQWLPFPLQPRMDRPLVYWSGQGIKPSKAYLWIQKRRPRKTIRVSYQIYPLTTYIPCWCLKQW